MFANWTVAITLFAKSNFGQVAAQASQQSAAAQKSIGGLKSQMSGVAAMGKIVDKAMIGVGVASAATFAMGIKGASDLQNATVQAAIAMGKTGDTVAATTANMREFRDIALQMSKITGQSLPEAMGVVATMASAGITPAQIRADYKPIAQFTDVLHFGKDKMDYGEAAKLGAGLTHEMRLYSAGDLRFGLGEIARMGYLSPHGTQQLATQVRQVAPGLENLLPGDARSKAMQIVNLTAWADRLGGLQRFGTGMSQLLTNIVAPRSRRVVGSLEDLGVYDAHGKNRFFDKRTGTIDIMGALREVATHYKDAINMPGGRGQSVQSLMGLNANAARNFQLLTSKEALTAFASVAAQQKAMGADPAAWLDKTQALLMGELSTQTGLLTSNFKTLATLIADGFVGPLTKVVSYLAKVTGDADSYLAAHPKQAMAIGGGALAAATYAVVRTAQMGHNVVRAFVELGKHPHIGVGGGHLLGHETARAAAASARAGGLLGGGLEFAGGLLGLKNLRGFLGPIAMRIPIVAKSVGLMAPILESVGLKFFSMRLWMAGIGSVIGKIGARFIPFVGEALLVVDALNFLRTHMKDIGFLLGQAVGWIAKNFVPMIKAAAPVIWDAFKSLLQGIIDAINPAKWIKGFGDLANGVKAGFAAAPAPAAPVTVTVHVKGGSDPHKTGAIVGAAVAHHLAKAGVIRNAPLGSGFGGNAIPSAH